MRKTYSLLLVFSFISQIAMASKTDDTFWKNCPGPACPANMPNQDMDAYQMNEDGHKQMDKVQLKQIRNLDEKGIKDMKYEEKQRHER